MQGEAAVLEGGWVDLSCSFANVRIAWRKFPYDFTVGRTRGWQNAKEMERGKVRREWAVQAGWLAWPARYYIVLNSSRIIIATRVRSNGLLVMIGRFWMVKSPCEAPSMGI